MDQIKNTVVKEVKVYAKKVASLVGVKEQNMKGLRERKQLFFLTVRREYFILELKTKWSVSLRSR